MTSLRRAHLQLAKRAPVAQVRLLHHFQSLHFRSLRVLPLTMISGGLPSTMFSEGPAVDDVLRGLSSSGLGDESIRRDYSCMRLATGSEVGCAGSF